VANLTSRKLGIAEAALRRIVTCDYRGNRPFEQAIAEGALAEIAALSKNPGRHTTKAGVRESNAKRFPTGAYPASREEKQS
jgi:hypothetical protein